MIESKELIKEFEKMDLEVCTIESTNDRVYMITFQKELLENIKRCQEEIVKQDMESLTEEETVQSKG